MKKIQVIEFLLILFSLTCHAQGTYSKQSLAQASRSDLDFYLIKAVKLKKAGTILTIAGPASFLTGTLLAGYSSMGGTGGIYKFGMGMVFAGIGATAAGIPILITGSARVKRLKKAMNTSGGIASVDLLPCSLFNYRTQKFQPGIGLRIRF